MKIIYNNIIPFPGFIAMNLFGVLFARKEYGELSETTIRHESIHSAQIKELWYIPFYLIYLAEWIGRWFMPGNTYRNISFEREAYEHESDPDYLKTRKRFAMWGNNEIS